MVAIAHHRCLPADCDDRPDYFPDPACVSRGNIGGTLSHRHIGVVGEEFAVSSDAREMFGVLDLEAGFEGADLRSGFGTLTTNDSGWHARSDCECLCVTISRFEEIQPHLGETLETLLAGRCSFYSIQYVYDALIHSTAFKTLVLLSRPRRLTPAPKTC
jgi:hypothetical protein